MLTLLTMLGRAIAALALAWRARVVYPDAAPAELARAAWEMIGVASSAEEAAVLLAMSEHESDLKPCAVSYVTGGVRHDVVPADCTVAGWYPLPVVAGYLQATFYSRAEATAAIQRDGAVVEGVAQLHECAADCRRWGMPDTACMLREYAGGVACARDAGQCKPAQRAFVGLFLSRAVAIATRSRSGRGSSAPRSDW